MMDILVTGGTGMIGNALRKFVPQAEFLNRSQFHSLGFQIKDRYIIHLAARVGGVKNNTDNVADFYIENSIINNKLLDSACFGKAKKVVSLLSTCVYPDAAYVAYPLTEEQLHIGPPHHSNFGYAYAKRMLEVQSRAYRQQFGCNFISVIPNNLYGPNDNYDLDSGHVIPALIRKFHEAKSKGAEEVYVWGSGKPVREFTFARDAAKIILWLAENYDSAEPVNIGNPECVSIEALSKMIGEEIGYEGRVKFDASKPDGQYEKPSSNEKLRSLGWTGEYTPLRDGLRETIKSFVDRYPHVRGVTV